MELLHLGAGLILLVVVNIVLGSVGAWLGGKFDGGKLWRGLVKGVVIALCIGAAWLAGWLNPDILAVDLGGTAVNLSAAVTLLLTAAFAFYGAQVVKKIGALFGGKVQPEVRITGADVNEETGVG